MNPDDSEKVVNFDAFELDFMLAVDSQSTENDEADEDDEPEYDNDEIFEKMLAQIPDDAVGLGTLDDEVDNFTSWEIEIFFSVIPLKNSEFNWALFGITWDDNWGRWGWECYARATTISDSHEAARMMIRHLFERWGYDLGENGDNAYKRFLNSI